jgi:hypothetical protein
MVGAGVLLECVADARVESVVAIVRSSTGHSHPKLREILHADFFNYDHLRAEFASCDARFFCLDVTSVSLDEAAYTRLTHDLTTAAARAMADTNPNMTFCYVSGRRTENAILALPFKAAFVFTPGFIQPVNGVRSRTAGDGYTTQILYPRDINLLG